EVAGERIWLLAAEPVDAAGAPGEVLPDIGLTIACGEQALAAVLVQRAGRVPMSGPELLRGFPIAPGTKIG
ncbi:MAG TPA: methionyl-tRNA formyltransferase, partial [Allosphingosinicella sp.]